MLAPGEDVVLGCVYIYPSEDPAYDVSVRSWVRATHSEFDAVLYRAVKEWLESAWPFRRVDYAPRP